MKWFMIAVMAVSFSFGGMAFAQEDDFDLDALLGDVGTTEQAPAGGPEAAVEPAAEEAAVADVAAPAEAAVDEIAATADAAVEDVVATADAAMEEMAAPAEEVAAPAEEVAAPAEAADPFAGFDEAPVAEEAAPVEAELAPVAETLGEEPAPVEETMGEEPAPAAEDADLLGDLFAEEAAPAEAPAVAEEVAPFEEPASVEEAMPAEDLSAEPVVDEGAAEEPVVDFTDMGEGEEEPAAIAKKDGKKAEKPDSRQLKKIAKETAELEEVRRQAAETDALKASEDGFRSLSDGNYAAAEGSFSSALKNLPDRPQNAAVRDQIAWGLAEAQYLQARPLVQNNERLPEARKLVDSALANAKDHRGAQALDKRLAKLETAAMQPKDPADQPATVEKAKSIEQLYDEARQWYMLKDYDRASALFEKILSRDPYHKSAMRYIRKIEADKFKVATYEREARVQGMMTEVRRSWSPPTRAAVEMPEDTERPGGLDSRTGSTMLQEKMKDIIIPEVQFRQANINDVVNFLVEASVAADPEGRGVNIILNLGPSGGGGSVAPAPAEPAADEWGDLGGDDFGAAMPDAGGGGGGVRDITLNLRRISMLDAVKYITEVAGLKFRIEDSAVMITPLDAPVGNIVTRMYPVQPSFMDVIIEREAPSESDSEFTSMGQVTVTKGDVKSFFEKTGVKFPVGASVTYNATISQLIVANTADNLETFERILQQINVVPNQVEIEARFVEVDQSDLEELGLQWILNDNYEFATKNDGSGGRMQVNANNNGLTQGNRFFSYNSDRSIIEPASPLTSILQQTPLGSILSASSVLTNPEVTVVLQALSQHGGTDLLSAPRVTTRSGVNAQIQVVKEIIYPTEFDLTQPTVNTVGDVTTAAIVTPGTFETRETGVILNVTPTVGPDGWTIDLVMAPEVAELVDWIQYGSTITFGQGDVYFFNIPQPVFTSRNVTTSIVIWDGQTVVMGGLIREELTTIRDKVPILGDIPLIGWLFRSEGQNSVKKNLLIFVTARLVDPAGRPVHSDSGLMLPGAGIDAPDASAAVEP